jgi:hypothetical protein
LHPITIPADLKPNHAGFSGVCLVDDSVATVELPRPAELRAQALAVGDNRRRIAGGGGQQAAWQNRGPRV